MKKVLLLILIIIAFQGCRSLSFEEYNPETGKRISGKWSSCGLFKTEELRAKVGSMEISANKTHGDAGEGAIAAGKWADVALEGLKKVP